MLTATQVMEEDPIAKAISLQISQMLAHAKWEGREEGRKTEQLRIQRGVDEQLALLFATRAEWRGHRTLGETVRRVVADVIGVKRS